MPDNAIASEAKHAAAYGFGGKDGAAADLSTRTLHDVYLRPWKEYAEAGGRGAMLSHNAINDVPAHANAELMGLIRKWGTKPTSTDAGVGAGADAGAGAGAEVPIMMASDMCDIGRLAYPAQIHGSFGVAKDLLSAGALSMGAGMDQELCNPSDSRGQAFTSAADAVKAGVLDQASLDRAAGDNSALPPHIYRPE